MVWRDACRPILWRNLALVLRYSWTPPWPLTGGKYDKLAELLWGDVRPPQQVQKRIKTIHGVIDFFNDRPDLACYVRDLSLVVDIQSGTTLPGFIRLDLPVLLELLRCLPFIQDLHLKNIRLKPVTAFYSFPFPELRRLSYFFSETFTGGPLRGTEELLVPLRLFTNIDQLHLSRKFCACPRSLINADPAPGKMGPVQCRIRSLSVDVETPWLPRLLKGLMRDLDPPRVHTLELCLVCKDNLEVARSLRRLSLRFFVPPPVTTLESAALFNFMQSINDNPIQPVVLQTDRQGGYQASPAHPDGDD